MALHRRSGALYASQAPPRSERRASVTKAPARRTKGAPTQSRHAYGVTERAGAGRPKFDISPLI
jgi:hypothetical protein